MNLHEAYDPKVRKWGVKTSDGTFVGYASTQRGAQRLRRALSQEVRTVEAASK